MTITINSAAETYRRAKARVRAAHVEIDFLTKIDARDTIAMKWAIMELAIAKGFEDEAREDSKLEIAQAETADDRLVFCNLVS